MNLVEIIEEIIYLRAMLDEAVGWLKKPVKEPKEDYADFLLRYKSLKEKQIENGRRA